jgi:hypothetical protein
MLISTAFEVGMDIPYYITWVVFGHVVGIHSSAAASINNINVYTISHVGHRFP